VEADRVRPRALAQGLGEEHLELSAVHRVLGPAVAGLEPARLAVDLPPVAGHEGPLERGDADPVELARPDPEVAELAHGVGLEVDRDAERGDLGRALEDREGHAELVQRQADREAADAPARDEDARCAHARPPCSTVKRSTWTSPASRAPVPTSTSRLSHV